MRLVIVQKKMFSLPPSVEARQRVGGEEGERGAPAPRSTVATISELIM